MNMKSVVKNETGPILRTYLSLSAQFLEHMKRRKKSVRWLLNPLPLPPPPPTRPKSAHSHGHARAYLILLWRFGVTRRKVCLSTQSTTGKASQQVSPKARCAVVCPERRRNLYTDVFAYCPVRKNISQQKFVGTKNVPMNLQYNMVFPYFGLGANWIETCLKHFVYIMSI